MPVIPFRHIDEGDGGTFEVIPKSKDPKNVPPLPGFIGTYKLNTCVGVYFRVDKKQCFFAHMDARTGEVWPHMMVTRAAGLKIVNQVKSRLLDFVSHDRWDITHALFGTQLVLQCPSAPDYVIDGKRYHTPGHYTIRAIREFLIACSRFVATMPGATQAQMVQAATLKSQATETTVDDNNHVLIVDPTSGRPNQIGPVRNPPRSATSNDLGNFKAFKIGVVEDDKSLCRFGVDEDDASYFPKNELYTAKPEHKNHKRQTKAMLEEVRTQHRNFRGTLSDETKRLSEILEQTHL